MWVRVGCGCVWVECEHGLGCEWLVMGLGKVCVGMGRMWVGMDTVRLGHGQRVSVSVSGLGYRKSRVWV